MEIHTFTETIWPCLNPSVEYLAKQRNANLSKEVKAGLNFSIILGSACLLEGILEATLKVLLAHRAKIYYQIKIEPLEHRRSMNLFYQRLEKELEARIERSVGAAGYDEMFSIILGTRLSQLEYVALLWETVTALFHFRNSLGHGREIIARGIVAYYAGESVLKPVLELEKYSHRQVEEYLLKKKLLKSKFIHNHDGYLFLSDKIADHFRQLAILLPKAIIDSLPDAEKEDVCKVLAPLFKKNSTPAVK
jgi:hypothetical protein